MTDKEAAYHIDSFLKHFPDTFSAELEKAFIYAIKVLRQREKENVERVRLKPIEDRGGYLSERGDEPTVLFKGVPLCYAENGFVNTYCRNRE